MNHSQRSNRLLRGHLRGHSHHKQIISSVVSHIHETSRIRFFQTRARRKKLSTRQSTFEKQREMRRVEMGGNRAAWASCCLRSAHSSVEEHGRSTRRLIVTVVNVVIVPVPETRSWIGSIRRGNTIVPRVVGIVRCMVVGVW